MIVLSETILHYDKFLTYAVPYIGLNGVAMGVTPEQMKFISNIPIDWDPAMDGYANPATHGDATTAQMNFVYAADNSYFNKVCQQIKINPSYTLSPMDYLVLNIHQDAKRRTTIPAPDQRIGIVCKSFSHLNNVYQVFDIANLTHGGKPKDVRGIIYKMLILKSDAPFPTLDQLITIGEVSTMIFDVPFTLDQLGMIAYIAVCFVNNAGESKYTEILASPII